MPKEARVTYFTRLQGKSSDRICPPSSITQRICRFQSLEVSPHNAARAPRSLSFRRFFCASRYREDER